MTGPEHYRAAEEEFVWSASFMKEGDFSAADRSLVRAQVHATLALAAANAPRPPGRTAHDDWRNAIYGQWEEQ